MPPARKRAADPASVPTISSDGAGAGGAGGGGADGGSACAGVGGGADRAVDKKTAPISKRSSRTASSQDQRPRRSPRNCPRCNGRVFVGWSRYYNFGDGFWYHLACATCDGLKTCRKKLIPNISGTAHEGKIYCDACLQRVVHEEQ